MKLRSGLALFRHHRHLTSRLAGRLGRSEAEDLASEAVVRGLARPAPDGRLAPWIETIFRNLLVDRARRQARRGDDLPWRDGVTTTAATPEETTLAHERARVIAAAMPAMPADLREAVVARFYDEQDYDEMAATRGISATTARTRVHRGLARLRRSLEGLRAMWPTFAGGAAIVPAAAVALLAIFPAGTRPPLADRAVTVVAQVAPARGPRPVRAAVDARPAPSGHSPRPPAHRAPVVAPATDEGDHEGNDAAVKHLDFEDDEIPGELQRPGIVLVTGSPLDRKLGSLIEIPVSFEPSMTKMIEDM